MKQILFVDDDPVVLEIYRRKFVAAGFELQSATDGLAAMKRLSTMPAPHLVVLDLMMPRMNGVDVLKFMRSRPDLKSTPVIILSNSFMSDVAQAAAVAGADKALLKSRCPPALLLDVVNELLSGQKPPDADAALLAAADYAPTMAAAVSAPAAAPPPVIAAQAAPAPAARPASESQSASPTKLREDFLHQAPATLKGVRDLLQTFLDCKDDKTRQFRLADLYRKIHFLSSGLGIG